MGQAKLYGQNKGGMSINGIIKDYYVYAGENISAGDLVEYINGVASKTDYGVSEDIAIDNTNEQTGYAISAVKLDENRVFIAHSYGSSYYLYGVVVTVNGASIEMSTDTAIESYSYAGHKISVCLLSKDKVFIAHSRSSDYNLYGIVVTIDSTTITKGTNTNLETGSEEGYRISALALDENRVFIAHSSGSSTRHLYGMLCTISGTTITAGTDTAIVSKTNAGYTISTCLLPNGNVFIAHSYGSNYYLYGIVCSISGTTITKGSDTAIVSSNNSGYTISAVTLEDNKVFIAHSHTSNTSGFLYGIVCTISGATITVGIDTELCRKIYAGEKISAIALSEDKVFIAHQYGGSRYLYGTVCTISETTITVGTVTDLISVSYAGYTISSLLLNNGVIFVAHNNSDSYYLNAQIFAIDENNIPTNNVTATEYETQVRKVTTAQFDGIAKTSGEGSSEYVEVEVTKTGNLFPTSWATTSRTQATASDGTTITASSSYDEESTPDLVTDGDENTEWIANDVSGDLTIKLTETKKITKMKVRGYTGVTLSSLIIQGSNNETDWIDLHSSSDSYSSLTEIELSNADYYSYYKLSVVGQGQNPRISEWQASEYTVKEQVPSTGHKDIVSIWTMPQEVVYEGNIFPTSGWNEEVSKLKYSTDSGYIIEADSVADIGTDDFHSYRACDNSLDSYYYSGHAQEQQLTITLPKPVKITKMKTSIYVAITDANNLNVKGSKDGNVWVNLGSPALVTSLASTPPLTEFTLDNPDYYTYYRIYGNLNNGSNSIQVREWQTSEYIVLE